MADAKCRPAAIDLERGAALRIRWADGHTSDYPLVRLRQMCPCATCRHEREERSKNPLRVLKTAFSVEEMTTAETAELVGHYALRIRWRDGHDTGIYDYVTLRGMCPCAACQARGTEA